MRKANWVYYLFELRDREAVTAYWEFNGYTSHETGEVHLDTEAGWVRLGEHYLLKEHHYVNANLVGLVPAGKAIDLLGKA